MAIWFVRKVSAGVLRDILHPVCSSEDYANKGYAT